MSMAGEFMSATVNLTHRIRISIGGNAGHKKRGLDLLAVEQIEQRGQTFANFVRAVRQQHGPLRVFGRFAKPNRLRVETDAENNWKCVLRAHVILPWRR